MHACYQYYNQSQTKALYMSLMYVSYKANRPIDQWIAHNMIIFQSCSIWEYEIYYLILFFDLILLCTLYILFSGAELGFSVFGEAIDHKVCGSVK